MSKSQAALQFFAYEHLPERLQPISKPFGELAKTLVDLLPDNVELETCLRKLMEAKDCAVRAQIYKPVDPATLD